MIKNAKSFVFSFLLTTTLLYDISFCGTSNSLDRELNSILKKTESFLVTVKGVGGARNLVATGIIYDSLGHILTSAYISNSQGFKVIFKNGKSYSASKVGYDMQSGLAVLKIDGLKLPAPKWGDSAKLESNGWIIVIGNSYNIPSSVNFGNFVGLTDDGLLQLSVNVNPGSSGAAVLDTEGEIVGILIAREAYGIPSKVSLARSPGQIGGNSLFENSNHSMTGYAIPIDVAGNIVNQIIDSGHVSRGFLGVGLRKSITASSLKLADKLGLIVDDVAQSSPAEKAGLAKGDVILAIDSVSACNRGCVYNLVRAHLPGDTVKIRYRRNGEEKVADAILADADSQPLSTSLRLNSGFQDSTSSQKNDLSDNSLVKSKIDSLTAEMRQLQDEIANLKSKIRR